MHMLYCSKEGLNEVLLCERVNDLRHSLFHLINCLITTASELREKPKITGSKVWTTWRVRNCLYAPLGDALSWWKCHWPDLKRAGLFRRNLFLNSLKTQHSNPNPNPNSLANQLCCIDLLLPHHSSSLTEFLPSLNLLCHSKTDARFMQDAPKAVWSIPYVFLAFFSSLKQNVIAYRSSKVFSRPDCIFKFTSCDNQALVRCIPVAAVAVHLKLKS